MTLDEARNNIGKRILYTPPIESVKHLTESGTIIGVGNLWVRVVGDNEDPRWGGALTPAEDIILINHLQDDEMIKNGMKVKKPIKKNTEL